MEICPNCIEIQDVSITQEQRQEIRNKYGIPLNMKVFVYGGNLGKPQGIPFFIDCLKTQVNVKEAFFLIVGGGTEFFQLQHFMDEYHPENMKLLPKLPKEDYEKMVSACDVGMIFLDHRFTIPNFPSRILSYMQAGLPVLAVTDPNTDIGRTIENAGFGWWSESNDIAAFIKTIDQICTSNISQVGKKGFEFLNHHYTVDRGYNIIIGH